MSRAGGTGEWGVLGWKDGGTADAIARITPLGWEGETMSVADLSPIR